MGWIRTEEEVDILIEAMLKKGKGKYVTQGVAFNKSCPRQMGLLKKALMASQSFSGLGKELLAIRFSETELPKNNVELPLIEDKKKNTGNFLS